MNAPKPSLVPRVALALLFIPAILRSLTTFDPLPAWSADPTTIDSPFLGLTPTTSLLCDACVLLAGAWLVLSSRHRPSLPGIGAWTCALAGIGVAFWHALKPPVQVDPLVTASAWSSAVVAALALAHACQDRDLRRLAAGTLVGLIVALALKGISQVFIEHPATVEMYRANKQAFLDAQGWTADSPMARAYERRLMQPEATGWFGLANVYASFAAFSLVALLGLLARSSTLPRWCRLVLNLGALLAAGALYLAGSKGGYAALAFGVGLVTLPLLAKHIPLFERLRRAPLIGLAALLLPIGAILLRGAIGTRLSELSLLFRAFYFEAAARIASKHPFAGVGPSNFKDAYLLAKNPLSPEDVASPHNVIAEFIATLGLGGIALTALLVMLAIAAARAACDNSHTPDPAGDEHLRPAARWFALTFAVPTILAAMLEQPLASVDAAALRLISLVGATCVSLGVWRSLQARSFTPIAAAALAILAHAQIEMTPTAIGSCALFFIALGVGAANQPDSTPLKPSRRDYSRIAGPFVALAALTTITLKLPSLSRWESHLKAAQLAVAPLPDLDRRANAIALGRPDPGDTPAGLVRDALPLLQYLPPTDPSNPPDFRRVMMLLWLERTDRALAELDLAEAALPAQLGVEQAIARLHISRAARFRDAGLASQATTEVARALAAPDARLPLTAGSESWRATIERAAWELTREPGSLDRAIERWTAAARLAPFSPMYPLQLALASADAGKPDLGAKWARTALELDANIRLDPLSQFSAKVRSRLESLARPPDSGP